MIDARIELLSGKLRDQHDSDAERIDDLAVQAREAFERGGAVSGRTELIDALLEATVARVDFLQRKVDAASQAVAKDGGRVDALVDELGNVGPRIDRATALEDRIDDLDAYRVDLAERTDKLVETYVERSSKRYARAVATFVRKDAATVAEELTEKHVAALRDELVEAQAVAGRRGMPLLPTLLAVAALAVATVALVLGLR